MCRTNQPKQHSIGETLPLFGNGGSDASPRDNVATAPEAVLALECAGGRSDRRVTHSQVRKDGDKDRSKNSSTDSHEKTDSSQAAAEGSPYSMIAARRGIKAHKAHNATAVYGGANRPRQELCVELNWRSSGLVEFKPTQAQAKQTQAKRQRNKSVRPRQGDAPGSKSTQPKGGANEQAGLDNRLLKSDYGQSAPALFSEADEHRKRPNTRGFERASQRHLIEDAPTIDRHMQVAWQLSKALKASKSGRWSGKKVARLSPVQKHKVGNAICEHLLASLREQVDAENAAQVRSS